MGSRRKILYVHHRPELGGAPTSLYYFLLALDKEEFEPHVYCPPGAAAALFASAGATVHIGPIAGFTHIWASTYSGRRWILFARELGRLPWHLFRLRQLLRNHDFELIHLNDSPLIAAAWLAQRADLPIVWHLRSALPGDGRDLRSRFVRRTIRRLASASIAINADVAAIFDVGAEIVPNSVDLERFRPGNAADARALLGLEADRPAIAFFGFIYPSKGFREFISAARLVRDRGVDANYVVVGGAVRGRAYFRTVGGRVLKLFGLAQNYELEAAELVSRYDLEDKVRFVPFTRDTAELYRAADIVVAPSTGPELGRPVIEAAASGIPVVATGSRSGGDIIVAGETGLLIPEANVEGLADAITSLVDDAGRRSQLGEAARRHAEEFFDPQINARRVEEIYRRVAPARDRIPVLYVHHRPQLGGAPSSLAELIRTLDPRFEPHVFVPAGPAADLFASAGATVHIGPVAIFAHVWDSPYGGLRWLILGRELSAIVPHVRQLRRLLKKQHFPIVHLNDSPLLASAWVAHRAGAHVVWHLRSALAGEGRDVRSRIILALMDRWGETAIAIDEDVAARFRLRMPVEIVHNSVPRRSEPLDPLEAKASIGLPLDRVSIGFFGFVRRQKGWREFVEAARLLNDAGAPAHFVVIGGGIRPPTYFRTLRGRILKAAKILTDEESAVRAAVEENGLSERFSFVPFRSDTLSVYSALDVVTFPNQGVGLGRPVLEAAAHGRPVVASGSHEGAGILMPGKTGMLLMDPSPERIAEALAELIADRDLRTRLGTAAAEHARLKFDAQRNARSIESIYDALAEGDNDRPAEDAPLERETALSPS